MAGRPRTMAKRVTALEDRVLQLTRDLFKIAPQQDLDHPNDRDPPNNAANHAVDRTHAPTSAGAALCAFGPSSVGGRKADDNESENGWRRVERIWLAGWCNQSTRLPAGPDNASRLFTSSTGNPSYQTGVRLSSPMASSSLARRSAVRGERNAMVHTPR